MYRVTEHPLPSDVRLELERIATIRTTPLRLAGLWAVKTMAFVAGCVVALFLFIGGLDYLVHDVFGVLSLCNPRLDVWSNVHTIGWVTGAAGVAAAALSHLKWRDIVDAARLAQLDLSSGRCEHCEVTISERHQVVDDEDDTFLLLPYDAASTLVLRLSPDDDARSVALMDEANWRSNWSWIRTRNLIGAWNFESSGTPMRFKEAVSYDDTNLHKLWQKIPRYSRDLPKDGDIIEVPFEVIVDHCHKVKAAAGTPPAPEPREEAAGAFAPVKR